MVTKAVIVPIKPDMISARLYAQRINVHPNTVYNWIYQGMLPVGKKQSKDGVIRYFVDPKQQPPHPKMGRPVNELTGDPDSLSQQLMRARIENLNARTEAIKEQAERDRRADADLSDDIHISVEFEDDEIAE